MVSKFLIMVPKFFLQVLVFVAAVSLVSSYKSPYHDPHFVGNRSVIVQMFEWRFDDLAKECEEFLGPKGFGAIQVSPPVNEHAIIDRPFYNKEVRFPWYQRYQTVSYKLDRTRSGTREQLKNMVERCNKANVRVYIDIVLNHMTGSGSEAGFGSSGSFYDANNYNYPEVPFNKSHFNDGQKCGTSDGTMHNIEDPWQTRNCELVGLRDLNQEIEYVRKKQIQHLNELIDFGVAGFRVDASKHMYPKTMLQTWQELIPLKEHLFGPQKNPFFYHEAVLPFKGSPTTEKVPGVGIEDYTKLGRILNFGHMHNLADVLKKRTGTERTRMKLSNLKNFGPSWDMMLEDEDSLNIVDNHDVQRYSSNVLSFHDRRLASLANIFMLSWPYGVTKIMSSYSWKRKIEGNEDKNSWWGPPHENDQNFTTKRVTVNTMGQCNDGWVCEHRLVV